MSETEPNEHFNALNEESTNVDDGFDLVVSNLDEIEKNLADELKRNCDNDGKELDPALSAPILHKLGKIYHKRSPDDILSYIRSAVLFNAAIVRSPEENKPAIESDLQLLCSNILTRAGAKNNNIDLIKKAKELKTKIAVMRNHVEYELKQLLPVEMNLHGLMNSNSAKDLSQFQILVLKEQMREIEKNKIVFIKKLQASLTAKYRRIMKNLAEFCHMIMHPSPCQFALIGMGSLAREEITPYSDFENAILLDDDMSSNKNEERRESILQHFRWFSIIFQTVLVNLQETIIPSVAVTSLNDYSDPDDKEKNWFYDRITPRGISFDGMMPYACKFPIGRQQRTKDKDWKTELIKPVNEMLEYLNSDVNLKNGYHLGDILTKVSYVYGDQKIFYEFWERMSKITGNQGKDEEREPLKSQIKNDLQSFGVKSTLSQIYLKTELNIKKDVYRSTTLFVVALGRLYDITESSCFEIIDELARERILSDDAKHKLMYGIALACEMRLRWYTKNKSQTDIIKDGVHQRAFEIFFNIAGKPSTFSYFQIAYALQCHVAKTLELKKIHFCSIPQLINISLYCCFYDPRHTNKKLQWDKYSVKNVQTKLPTERLYDFDECLMLLENDDAIVATEFHRIDIYNEIYQLLNVVENFFILGENQQSCNFYDDAMVYFRIAEKLLKELKQKSNIAFTDVSSSSNDSKEASKLDIQKKLGDWTIKVSRAILLSHGVCLMKLRKHVEAIHYFQEWLNHPKQFPPDCRYEDLDIKETLKNVGSCLIKINEPNNAKMFFEETLKIQKQEFCYDETSWDYAETLRKLGFCYLENSEPSKALKIFRRYLNMREMVSYGDNKPDNNLVETFENIGDCFVAMNRPYEAKQYFKKSVETEDKLYVRADDDTDSSEIDFVSDSEDDEEELDRIQKKGLRLLKLDRPGEALECFEECLELKERLSLDLHTDTGLSEVLLNTGKCLLRFDEDDEAKKHFDRALEILEKASINPKSLARTLLRVGKCYKDFPTKAIKYFNACLRILEDEASANANTIEYLASVLHDIGIFSLQMKRFTMAIQCIERSQDIRKQSFGFETDPKKLFAELHEIGETLENCYPEKALEYSFKCLSMVEEMSDGIAIEFDAAYAKTLHSIASCLLKKNRPQEAIIKFQQSLNIRERISVDVESDLDCADTKQYLGFCMLRLGKKSYAKSLFNESAKIYEQASQTPDLKLKFATSLKVIAETLLEKNEFKIAEEYLQKSLEIQEQVSQEMDDITLTAECASIHFLMGKCCLKKKEETEASKHFQRISLLHKSVAVYPNWDGFLHNIAQAYFENDYPIGAMVYFSRLLQINEDDADDPENDDKCAETLHHIGLCCLELNKPSDALSYFSKSLQMRGRLSTDIESDFDYADTILHIGLCMLDLQQISDALKHFQCFQFIMDQLISSDVDTDKKYADNLLNIGSRLRKLDNVNNAMKYIEKAHQIKKHTLEITENTSG